MSGSCSDGQQNGMKLQDMHKVGHACVYIVACISCKLCIILLFVGQETFP